LADVADQTTLTAQLSAVFGQHRAPQTAHDRGRVLADLAVMIADGGECISDIAALADQSAVFGLVASDSTCWRVLDSIDADDMAAIDAARAAARAVAWAQRAEQTGQPLAASLVAGQPLLDREGRAVLVIDDDATIVVTHSVKERTAATFKHTFGYHPMLAFCDNTNEVLAGMLRPGNAGANTATDHIALLDAALAQVPDEQRHGYPILVRADGAGASKAFLAHIRVLRNSSVATEFSIGWAVTDREHTAIAALPPCAWSEAIDMDGVPRDSAAVAELTGVLPAGALDDYPPGRRVHPARVWAQEHRIDVPSTGRLTQSVLDQWQKAGKPQSDKPAPSAGAGATQAAQAYRLLRTVLGTAVEDGLLRTEREHLSRTRSPARRSLLPKGGAQRTLTAGPGRRARAGWAASRLGSPVGGVPNTGSEAGQVTAP
jgi:hypothetical protein